MKTGRKTIIAVVFDREGPGKLYAGARAEEAIKRFIGRKTVTVFEIDTVYGLEELEKVKTVSSIVNNYKR
ncbi:MAG: hypothetical protein ACPLQP_01145 [Moorellaceae bacterium]